MKTYSKIVKSIREKFVGTSEEHDLLRDLQENAGRYEEQVKASVNEEYRERMEQVEHAQKRYESIVGTAQIDAAVFEFLSCRNKSDEEWRLKWVAKAMRGRGMDSALVEKLVTAIKLVEENEG